MGLEDPCIPHAALGPLQVRQVLGAVAADPVVSRFPDIPRVESLPAVLEQLDACQRALSAYLEDKRHLFPRFYFIGWFGIGMRGDGVALRFVPEFCGNLSISEWSDVKHA